MASEMMSYEALFPRMSVLMEVLPSSLYFLHLRSPWCWSWLSGSPCSVVRCKWRGLGGGHFPIIVDGWCDVTFLFNCASQSSRVATRVLTMSPFPRDIISLRPHGIPRPIDLDMAGRRGEHRAVALSSTTVNSLFHARRRSPVCRWHPVPSLLCRVWVELHGVGWHPHSMIRW